MHTLQDLISFFENQANSLSSEKRKALSQISDESVDDALQVAMDEYASQGPVNNSPTAKQNFQLLKQFLEETLELKRPKITSNANNTPVQSASAKSIDPKILIITSEGGSGHKEAAADSERKLLKMGYAANNIKKVFVLPQENAKEQSQLQLFDIDFGKQGVKNWNDAQKAGDMKKIKRMVAVQGLSEIIFGKNMEREAFRNLTQNQTIEKVIDTQALNSHHILYAVAEFNRIRADEKRCERFNKLVKWNNQLKEIPLLKFFAKKKYDYPIVYNPDAKPIILQKRMTDLPNRADHFFHSLKKIRKKDLPYFELEAPHAARQHTKLNDTQQREFDLAYYQKKCPNLFNKDKKPLINIEFSDGPIRQAFLHYKKHPVDKTKDFTINIKIANQAELSFLEKATGVDPTTAKLINEQDPKGALKQPLTLPANAVVDSVMLGSQAAVEATMAYVDTKIEYYNQKQDATPGYFFVFCGKHDGDESLFAQVAAKIEQEKLKGTFPPHLTIVPLTYQDDEMIASLYSRSDEAIIRAGGISCMEIEAVAQNKVVIHSEKKGSARTEKELLNGMLGWEKGNAEHVKTVLGKDRVTVVNSQTYRKNCLPDAKFKKEKSNIRKKLIFMKRKIQELVPVKTSNLARKENKLPRLKK